MHTIPWTAWAGWAFLILMWVIWAAVRITDLNRLDKTATENARLRTEIRRLKNSQTSPDGDDAA